MSLVSKDQLELKHAHINMSDTEHAQIVAKLHFVAKHKTFKLGDQVKKKTGSWWRGTVVGFYSTEYTPEGYAVESNSEKGSVQIYSVNALELLVESSAHSQHNTYVFDCLECRKDWEKTLADRHLVYGMFSPSEQVQINQLLLDIARNDATAYHKLVSILGQVVLDRWQLVCS